MGFQTFKQIYFNGNEEKALSDDDREIVKEILERKQKGRRYADKDRKK